jgi:hypothetical protein
MPQQVANRTYLLVVAAMAPLFLYVAMLVWKTAHGHVLFPGQGALVLGVGVVLAIVSAGLANLIRMRRDRSSRPCP